MLTVLAWIVFILGIPFNLIMLLSLFEMKFLTKEDWYIIVGAPLVWMASATYLFGFF